MLSLRPCALSISTTIASTSSAPAVFEGEDEYRAWQMETDVCALHQILTGSHKYTPLSDHRDIGYCAIDARVEHAMRRSLTFDRVHDGCAGNQVSDGAADSRGNRMLGRVGSCKSHKNTRARQNQCAQVQDSHFQEVHVRFPSA